MYSSYEVYEKYSSIFSYSMSLNQVEEILDILIDKQHMFLSDDNVINFDKLYFLYYHLWLHRKAPSKYTEKYVDLVTPYVY